MVSFVAPVTAVEAQAPLFSLLHHLPTGDQPLAAQGPASRNRREGFKNILGLFLIVFELEVQNVCNAKTFQRGWLTPSGLLAPCLLRSQPGWATALRRFDVKVVAAAQALKLAADPWAEA
jgi:hypothetical protein